MTKLTNEEKVIRLKKRKILRRLIIFFDFLVVLLSLLSLFKIVSFLIPLGICFIPYFLQKYRDKLDFKEIEEHRNYVDKENKKLKEEKRKNKKKK